MSAGMLKKWLWYDLRWWILNPDISWNVEKKNTLVLSQMMNSEARYQLECWKKITLACSSEVKFRMIMWLSPFSVKLMFPWIWPACQVVQLSSLAVNDGQGDSSSKTMYNAASQSSPSAMFQIVDLNLLILWGSVYGIVIEDLVGCHCSHALLCKSIFMYCVHRNNTWNQFVLVLLVLCCLCS
jgi:hypothetical protein